MQSCFRAFHQPHEPHLPMSSLQVKRGRLGQMASSSFLCSFFCCFCSGGLMRNLWRLTSGTVQLWRTLLMMELRRCGLCLLFYLSVVCLSELSLLPGTRWLWNGSVSVSVTAAVTFARFAMCLLVDNMMWLLPLSFLLCSARRCSWRSMAT